MLKFNFSVLTRNGQKVENILIAGNDQADAERKLRQMYHHCEVTHCEVKHESPRQFAQTASVEDILSLISK